MNKHIRSIGLVVLLLLPFFNSQRGVAQTLDSLVTLAERTYPSANAARLVIERADARARSASAWQAPSVGIDFNGLPFSNPNPLARGETALMVEQMIPLFGQNRSMSQAMAAGAAVGEQELAGVKRDLRARIEREYYTLWLLDRRSELNDQSRQIAEAIYKNAETQYSVSRAAQSDLFRVSLEIERLRSELQQIGVERNEALGRLNSILGRPLSTPVALEDTLPSTPLPVVDSLITLLPLNPQLKQMEAMAAMNEAEAKSQEAMLNPMLMLRGGLMYAPEGHPLREGSEMLSELGSGEMGASLKPMENPERLGFSVTAMLSIPLAGWSRGGPEAAAEASRLEAREQLERRDAMQRDMASMLSSAWSMAQRAQIKLDFYRKTQLPLLERTLQSLRADYTSDRVPFASLMEGYNMLVMSRMDAYMQQMEYAMALSELTQLTGARP